MPSLQPPGQRLGAAPALQEAPGARQGLREAKAWQGRVGHSGTLGMAGPHLPVGHWGAQRDRLPPGAACKGGLGILSQTGAGGHFSPLLVRRQAVWICLQCANFRFPKDVVDIICFHPSGEHRCKTDEHGGATVNDEPSLSNNVSLHFTTISGMTLVTHFAWCLYIEQHHFCAMCYVCVCWRGSLVLSGKKLYYEN